MRGKQPYGYWKERNCEEFDRGRGRMLDSNELNYDYPSALCTVKCITESWMMSNIAEVIGK